MQLMTPSILTREMSRDKAKVTAITALMLGCSAMAFPSYAEKSDKTKEVTSKSTASTFVIGSRFAGRTESDVPVPVDVIGRAELQSTGHTEVGRILQAKIPSFNFSSSSASDGTDALRPATLRGLGPDQTLVLINGKRRHQGALVHINTTVGRGTSGVDMNAIPAISLERIEVLRDGAAAQYGSDAIAGVINLVLKDGSDPGSIKLSFGEYTAGDGETLNLGISKGIELDNGFFNVSYDFRDRNASNRAGLSGQCQYICTDHPTLAGVTVSTDPLEQSFERQNFKVGDSDSEQHAVVINGSIDLDDSELYAFVTWSDRHDQSAGFYRRANQDSNNPILSDNKAYYPNGFLPLINTKNKDYSFNIGYKTEFMNEVTLDFSATTGENEQEYIVSNSLNASWVTDQGRDASLRGQAQTKANAGKLTLGLTTLNVDMTWADENVAYAWGGELRRDRYKMESGEIYSWQDYDGLGIGGDNGIQVFPGFTPANSVDESRNVYSLYFDAEWEINYDFLVTGALRYDDFDGFGDTVNMKVSSRYNVNEDLILRGALSSGFRAPSMQQQYFNNTSTQFIDEHAVQVGTFRNDSQLAIDVGIPELQEEESVNYSVGLTFNPAENITFTLDYYNIAIDNRIVISDKILSGTGSEIFDAAVASNNVTGAQFFINGANTKTQGLDIVTTYNTILAEGDLHLSLAFNTTRTEVTGQFSPGGLQGIKPADVFGAQGVSIIEEWQPKDRINLSANYDVNDFSYSASLNRFGEYAVIDGGERQVYGAKWLTDVQMNWHYSEKMSISIGVNNVFDVTPDINTIGQTGEGHIVDGEGNTIVQSDGVFQYSRRSAPFGFNGAYLYAGIDYRF